MPMKKNPTNQEIRKSAIAQELEPMIDTIISIDTHKLNESLAQAQVIQIYPLIDATINYFKIFKKNLGYVDSFNVVKRRNILKLTSNFAGILKDIEGGIPISLEENQLTSFKNLITHTCEDLYEVLFNGLIRISKGININKEKEADKMLQSIKEQKQESQSIIANLKYLLEQQERTSIEQSEAYQGEIGKLIDTIKEKEKESKERLKEIEEKATESLDEIRETESKFGTQTFSNIFEKQAQNNKQTAIRWLWACGLAAIGIGVFLVYIFNTVITTLKNIHSSEALIINCTTKEEIINKSINVFVDTINETMNLNPLVSLQIFFTKLLILSFLSIVFYQMIKNYNVNMHLYTTNMHRSNSLDTYPTFLAKAHTAEAKEKVLLQVTKCIFEGDDTGYISVKDHRIIPNMDVVLHKGKN